MGSVGSGYQSFTAAEYGLSYGANTNSPQHKWMRQNSNLDNWEAKLSEAEKSIIRSYTGSKFRQMNNALYRVPFDEIDPILRNNITKLDGALSSFELKRGLEVTRESSASIFGGNTTIDGIKNYLKQTNGVLQINGFMSSAVDNVGFGLNAEEIVVHYKIPSSKGAGAYVDRISVNAGENEFLFNRNGIYKYDSKSLRKVGNKIHINAKWLGRNKNQVL